MIRTPTILPSLAARALFALASFSLMPVGSQLLPGLGARVALGQGQDTTRMATPLLLKRVAEAVDGHRTGSIVYVVASHDYPNPVEGVFESADEAATRVQALGSRYAVFGPYRTILDALRKPQLMICKHIQSVMDKDNNYCPNFPVPLSDVESVTITVRMKSGKSRTETLPRETDAVFFTLAAIDKFALPYYARAVGIDETMRMRQRIVQRMVSP